MMRRRQALLWLSFLLFATAPVRGQDKAVPAGDGTKPPVLGSDGAAPSYATPASAPTLFSTHCAEAFASCDNRAEGCPDGLFIEADYLLFRPRRRNLDFALLAPSNQGIAVGTIESVDWNTESGFRIGAGYLLPIQGWDVGADYTYFHSSGSRAVARTAGETLFATMTHPGGIEQVDTANASSSLNYNVLDLEVGRGLNVGDRFTLRLFGGGRFAWIDQSENAFYNGGDANHALASASVDFNGAGLRLGGEGRMNLGWGLHLYAGGSGSLVVGDFRTHRLETNAGGAVTNVDVSEKFDKVVPVAELGLGVGWEYRKLQIRAGYEMTNWFGLVDVPDFVDDVHQAKFTRRTGDVSLDGLVLQVSLGF
jgi:hypothetical protein